MTSALAYLRERTQLGVKFGLTAMRRLTAELGHPERAYPTLLIAGTNGKGSVVAYLDAALTAAGLRVGRYTSPHLVRVNERIAVAGRPIGRRALDDVVGVVAQAADRLVRQDRLQAHPTYFEAVTLAAFEHFRREQVDVALLEVGMGGRLDATNVARPLASAIVTIGLDHEAFLGSTLAQIAEEKGGVLRRGRVTVLGRLPSEARRALDARARVVGARLVDASRDVSVRATASGLHARTRGRRYPPVRALPGRHQRDNLRVALALIESARAAGLDFDLDQAVGGLSKAVWPGRLQWLPGSPPILLDGAHNPDAARALAGHLRELATPFVLVFGAMADKDIESMARALFPQARAVVLTQSRTPRAATADEIAERVGRLAAGASRLRRPAEALALARRLAHPGEAVVVAGSLYLVGAVLGARSPRK